MILGLETSTTRASLALLDRKDGTIAWRSNFESDRAHNALIFAPVEELLGAFRDRITGIAVGIGPGSYGGVRVAISVANGLALVLGVPVRGVSSLRAWEGDEDSYYVIGDARRKTFFLAEVKQRELLGDPELLTEEEIADRIQQLAAEGRTVVTADASVSDRWSEVALSFPTAEAICLVAAKEDLGSWEEGASVEPHYLRAPYITTPKR